ncbi:hypothetical protein Ae201684P_003227 [Aphanomyces euteiches]|nr:hypothetical protein Ae201684P_003227 [Aphanomyces euteiches]
MKCLPEALPQRLVANRFLSPKQNSNVIAKFIRDGSSHPIAAFTMADQARYGIIDSKELSPPKLVRPIQTGGANDLDLVLELAATNMSHKSGPPSWFLIN